MPRSLFKDDKQLKRKVNQTFMTLLTKGFIFIAQNPMWQQRVRTVAAPTRPSVVTALPAFPVKSHFWGADNAWVHIPIGRGVLSTSEYTNTHKKAYRNGYTHTISIRIPKYSLRAILHTAPKEAWSAFYSKCSGLSRNPSLALKKLSRNGIK